ncbi:MAG: phosphomannose isomerase type II C-terminal cupin domain [Deltaproteobacteria bacterium]|nr:phosphomannose isomerase type II C-terminal cupin domain [Candidatus Anaeroferrophillacea bacterium]
MPFHGVIVMGGERIVRREGCAAMPGPDGGVAAGGDAGVVAAAGDAGVVAAAGDAGVAVGEEFFAAGQPGAPVHRPWGFYQVLAGGDGYQVKRLVVNPGRRLSLQLHHHREEHWVVAAGTALITVDADEDDHPAGAHVHIPVKSRHRLANRGTEPVVVIETQLGSYLGEDDIERFADDYQRV